MKKDILKKMRTMSTDELSKAVDRALSVCEDLELPMFAMSKDDKDLRLCDKVVFVDTFELENVYFGEDPGVQEIVDWLISKNYYGVVAASYEELLEREAELVFDRILTAGPDWKPWSDQLVYYLLKLNMEATMPVEDASEYLRPGQARL